MGCIFFWSELILALALMVQMLVLRYSIQQMSIKTAMSEVKLLDLTYSIKVMQTGFGMRGQSQNTAITNYLETGVNPKGRSVNQSQCGHPGAMEGGPVGDGPDSSLV